ESVLAKEARLAGLNARPDLAETLATIPHDAALATLALDILDTSGPTTDVLRERYEENPGRFARAAAWTGYSFYRHAATEADRPAAREEFARFLEAAASAQSVAEVRILASRHGVQAGRSMLRLTD